MTEAWINGDEGRLLQAVGNMLNNALSHIGPDKRIEVRQTLEGETMRVEITAYLAAMESISDFATKRFQILPRMFSMTLSGEPLSATLPLLIIAILEHNSRTSSTICVESSTTTC